MNELLPGNEIIVYLEIAILSIITLWLLLSYPIIKSAVKNGIIKANEKKDQ